MLQRIVLVLFLLSAATLEAGVVELACADLDAQDCGMTLPAACAAVCHSVSAGVPSTAPKLPAFHSSLAPSTALPVSLPKQEGAPDTLRRQKARLLDDAATPVLRFLL
jgi:hypothetical protein